jgi:hypothetical protein
MPDYRLYIFDDDGKFTPPAVVIHASNDDDAIREAEAAHGVVAAELRDGFRLVKVFLHGTSLPRA